MSEFEEVKEDSNVVWITEHQIDIAKDIDEEVKTDLRANLEGEYSKADMYLAVGRVAFHEGYPEISGYWRRATLEEAGHASRFAEMLDEVVTSSVKKNLEMRVAAELSATRGKVDLATLAKKQNLDMTHDSVHEVVCDEVRHGEASQGLLRRHFGREK